MSVTYFQNMPIWNKLVLHEKIKELLHPILVSERSWFSKETVFAGTLVLQGTGFAGNLVPQRNWFHRETGSAGKLVLQGSWSDCAQKLVSQANWFRKDTGFARKLASQRNWLRRETGFLLPLLKFLSLYLWWKKLLIMQKLVTLQFCDF